MVCDYDKGGVCGVELFDYNYSNHTQGVSMCECALRQAIYKVGV